MKRSNRFGLAVGGIALGVLLPLRAIAQDYSSINIFGDSLVDAGNLFNLTGFPPSPPYNKKFSNGAVWVEPFAEKLGLEPVLASEAVPGLLAGTTPPPTEGVNFALGGSFSSDQNVGPGLPGLEQQIGTFGALSTALPVESDDLFVLLAGGNDYNQAIPSLDPATAPATVPAIVGQLADEVTNNLTSAASALIGLGAKHLLVANLPDLSVQPRTAQLDLFNPQISALFSQASTQHNKLLAQKLTGLAATTDAEITQLNLNELLAGITAAPAEFGFSNAEDTCLSASGVCSNPDEFVFWDDVHPTDAVHQIIADLAIETLAAKETGGESGEPKSVPEPTGVVGLLLSAGLMVGVRQRAMAKSRGIA